ncbi:MAG: FAD-dependent oxidoreductase [Thaumarchaeota archaeon]|nr:FAD-dependent oxidoreductase [Nitrososphaerota archaeon]
MLELVVIGGGPAGLIAAREAAREGVEVTVFEEHHEIGEPERCAGLLSLSGLRKIKVSPYGKHLQNLVRGAVVKGVTGKIYSIDLRRPVAAVVSRRIFDKKLASQAERAGAKIICGARVKRVQRSRNSFNLITVNGCFSSRWVIDAEGAGASILKSFLGLRTEPNKWIPITQLIVEGHELDKNFVYMYFKKYLPHFFSYLIPIDGDLGKLGVASRAPNLKKLLEKFLREEFPDVRILSRSHHLVYTGFPINSVLLYLKRFIPVGDAAGHVKATTGGGVIMGGYISANLASAVAEEIRGGCAEKFLEEAGRVIAELRRIALLRRLFADTSSPVLDILLSLLLSNLGKAFLSRFADMDFQVSSILKLKP